MPRFIILISFLVLFATVSCKKSESTGQTAQTGLSGSWLAYDYIADPGNGDVRWLRVTADPEVISFDNNGKGSIYSNGVQSGGYYQVTSDSTMDIVGGAFSSSAYYFLSAKGDSLSISGLCIETCVTRYVRAKQD